MRVLIFDTCYEQFLASHYAERPALRSAAYAVQWRALMDRLFGTSDSYSHFLGELGHEAHEVVLNCRPLQEQWAIEHRHRRTRLVPGRRRASIPLAQAAAFAPDVVYVQDVAALPPGLLRAVRAHTRLLVGQVASELPSPSQLEPFDLVLTSFPHYVGRFRSLGLASEYFRLGFDPRVLPLVADERPLRDVVFVGAVGRSSRWGANELLQRAADRVRIDFWGYEAGPIVGAVESRYHGEAWGLDMYRVLASARIVLNRHLDAAEEYANNMRLYEATGVGALLITDAKRNLRDLFEPGREVDTYTSEEELVEKVRYYLGAEDARRRVARAGQERTLREHTYRERMAELVEILSRHLP